MYKRILSASVDESICNLRFQPGINILRGPKAEAVLLTLASIFGGSPPCNATAKILWNADTSLFISLQNGVCFVTHCASQSENTAQQVKVFHKKRFLNYHSSAHIFDGAKLPAGTSGASKLLLKKLEDALIQKDDRPLFICNFLERLDEAIDLQPIFDTLQATGRQIFIAVPNQAALPFPL